MPARGKSCVTSTFKPQKNASKKANKNTSSSSCSSSTKNAFDDLIKDKAFYNENTPRISYNRYII